MIRIPFYDRNGNPRMYIEDDIYIYDYKGNPLAYRYNISIYTYGGKHIAWLLNGWIRDNNGMCLLFTDKASGGPIKPVRKIQPIPMIKKIRPVTRIRHIAPHLPIKRIAWSNFTIEDIFYNN